jgi:uncharacterized protein with ParB-like and HNH nuclease domain
MPEQNEQQQVKEIHGQSKSVRMLLSGVKYSIDYYQREYKWEEKQITELIDDLTNKFRLHYELGHERRAVRGYGHYFLGSIIISKRNNANFIIDGQQRLTSLTLLLIYLRNLYKTRGNTAYIDPLVFSEQFGERDFNIQVDERRECMEALYEGHPYDASGKSESLQNIVARYDDIAETFPEELEDDALPYFVDWLIENVHLVEITAYSDEDAYTIFETMNDRGLSLSPTEMLKGYLLANIGDENTRNKANTLWKERVRDLRDLRDLVEQGKEIDGDAIKAWLRSQYAESIRERKRGATPEDYDVIGTAFHRWVRDNREDVGLDGSTSYAQFISRDFDFYSKQYLRLIKASAKITSGLEHIFYNAQHGFTLQYQLLLAPLTPDDSEQETDLKLKLVGMFVDILLNRRIWNYHSISYSTMQYAMFNVMHDIRRKKPKELAKILLEKLEKDDPETFASSERFALHQMNRKYMQRILARLTDYVETESGMPSHYVEYTTGKGQKKYEIEHIWADHPERHKDEFPHPTDFAEYRNRIGGLLLLPKSFNGSYGDLPYTEKLPHYYSQNLLARSLNKQAYDHNPSFKYFVSRSGLPFHAHSEFKKADLDERQALYIQIAERLWNPARLTELVE